MEDFDLSPASISYIRGVLSQGKTLSRLLLMLRLEQGRTHAFLPEGVSEAARERFDRMGVLPRTGKRVLQGEYVMELKERSQVDIRMAEFISGYIDSGPDHIAVFEHALARRDDPWLSERAPQHFFFDDEVYFFVGRDNTTEHIMSAMRAARTYLFMAVLAHVRVRSVREGANASGRTLRRIAAGTEHILVGAYDGQAEIIWSRASTADAALLPAER
jgi:hypothetical protein